MKAGDFMARLSDVIEEFIKELFDDNGSNNELQIQRNELADKFSCAPSQINYVLSTRFTNEKGYLIESRRGGGGYIVIKRVANNNFDDIRNLIFESIGDSITYHNSVMILEHLYEMNRITEREFNIIKISIADSTLQGVEDRNRLRAEMLKSMILVIL